jgi:hypothetical protein
MPEQLDENDQRIASGVQVHPIAENTALGPQ